jgi:hypothetical protein
MSREQRWAASGVVVLLGALWGAVGAWTVSEPYRWDPPNDHAGTGLWVFAVGLAILAITALWLVAGLVTARRVAAGEWRWWPVAGLSGLAAVLSLVCAGATWSSEEAMATALFGIQALALVAYSALLWTPAPVASPPEPAA